MPQSLHEDNLFIFISTIVYSQVLIHLSELKQHRVNEIAQAPKWKKEDSNPRPLEWEYNIVTTIPLYPTKHCI